MAATKGLAESHHQIPTAECEVAVWMLIVVLLAIALFATAILLIRVAG